MTARSEFELIAALRERTERAGGPRAPAELLIGSGDDAAVSAPDGLVVLSVDALVDGVHFRRPAWPPASIGHKALAAALSDLAAMGAAPAQAYVQLGIPEDLSDADCLEIADGLAAVAAAHGVAIAGGDVSRSPTLFLAVTVLGSAASKEELVPRSGARPGDVVMVTGRLGGAAAGLRLLEDPSLAATLDENVVAALRRRQLEPEPRLAAGSALAGAGATAMIDISDGLGGDAVHLAEASGVALAIELERVPVDAGVAALAEAAGLDPIELATAGGEDYELLATVPEARLSAASDAVAAAGTELAAIGEVASGDGVEFRGTGGERRPATGFDQLRPPRGRAGPASADEA